MDLGETRVLANWQPSELSIEVIKEEFQIKVKELLEGVRTQYSEVSGIDFRYPHENTRPSDTAGMWHRDCGGRYDEYVAVWSNKLPTEVRLASGKRLKAEDGDIVLLHNSVDEHRAPRGVRESGRWFARVRVKEADGKT